MTTAHADASGTAVHGALLAAAIEFGEYVESVQKNADLWRPLYRLAVPPDDLVDRADRLSVAWRLLVLSEDWCGDAANTVPIVARFIEATQRLSLKILPRDSHLELMDAHLSSGTRSIPVFIAQDEEGREFGWWGPRPRSLQRWVRSDGLLLPKEDRYRRTRLWYARDRGRTAISEILDMMERAERRRSETRGG